VQGSLELVCPHVKKLLNTFEWKEGAAVGLWGTLIVAAAVLFAGTSFVLTYSSPSTLAKSCQMAAQNACVDFGRTASVAMLLLALCLVLGALQICRIVNARSTRSGLLWRALTWATNSCTNLNETVTRFALASSLLCAPLMALYVGWFDLREPRTPRGIPVWERDWTAPIIIATALWMLLESVANWRTIGREIGDWKRGVLSVLSIAILLFVKGWAGWTWQEIAEVSGSVAGAIGLRRWVFRTQRETVTGGPSTP